MSTALTHDRAEQGFAGLFGASRGIRNDRSRAQRDCAERLTARWLSLYAPGLNMQGHSALDGYVQCIIGQPRLTAREREQLSTRMLGVDLSPPFAVPPMLRDGAIDIALDRAVCVMLADILATRTDQRREPAAHSALGAETELYDEAARLAGLDNGGRADPRARVSARLDGLSTERWEALWRDGLLFADRRAIAVPGYRPLQIAHRNYFHQSFAEALQRALLGKPPFPSTALLTPGGSPKRSAVTAAHKPGPRR